MAQSQTTKKAIFSAANAEPTRGTVRLQHWERPERMRRALKMGGMTWGIALACVLIPLAHFVLVPGFLLAGPIVAYFVFQQTDVVLGGEGTCPRCLKPIQISRTKLQWPISDLCIHCQSTVEIQLE